MNLNTQLDIKKLIQDLTARTPTSHQRSVRMPTALYQQVKSFASHHGLSMSKAILVLLTFSLSTVGF
jgi:hypothetical protein